MSGQSIYNYNLGNSYITKVFTYLQLSET